VCRVNLSTQASCLAVGTVPASPSPLPSAFDHAAQVVAAKGCDGR
jgi:hypothetical protein